MTEKRRAVRISTKNISADLSNKYFAFCGCDVSDISASGLCIDNIPKRLIAKNKLDDIGNIVAVVEHENKYIKLKLIPRWVSPNSTGVSIGFELDDKSQSWDSLIQSKLPKQEDDVWGIRGLKINNREVHV